MSSPKELRYFVDNEPKGLDWYLRFFEGSENYRYRGEFASNYIYFPETADKIKATLGDVKIIAVVRDPVKRALSHIKHLVRDGDLPEIAGEIDERRLKEILDKHPNVLTNSRYMEGLSRYHSVFGRSSVFVVTQELCQTNSEKVLQALWDFMEVSRTEAIAESNKVVSAGVIPRNQLLERTRKKIFIYAKHKAPWLINWVKKIGLSSLCRKVNRGQDIFFTKNATQFLMDLCMEDWKQAQHLLTIKE